MSSATEAIDAKGRRVIVSKVAGDLPGVLTLALDLDPSGVVSGGEWALDVSYIQFGPVPADGDGDPSETLVQRGVIKGTITGGSAILAGTGLASDLYGVRLNINGATVQFSSTTTGTGTVSGSGMNQQASANGTLTISF